MEIVDRYDVACVPEHLQDDKLAYIQNSTVDKTCTRKLNVGPSELLILLYISLFLVQHACEIVIIPSS